MAEFIDIINKINKICNNYSNDCETCPYMSYMNCLSNSYDTNTLKEIEKIAIDYNDTDWSKVPVDTKILVRDAFNHHWINRYFAKYENGQIYAFEDGSTSWTSHGKVTHWEIVKLYEEGAGE